MKTIAPPQDESLSRTKIVFDLADELTPEEIESFDSEARKAGVTLKEHFLNLTLRLPAPANP